MQFFISLCFDSSFHSSQLYRVLKVGQVNFRTSFLRSIHDMTVFRLLEMKLMRHFSGWLSNMLSIIGIVLFLFNVLLHLDIFITLDVSTNETNAWEKIETILGVILESFNGQWIGSFFKPGERMA
uniref:Uncharacterized protein n=1 Tax=Glossina palpalis gambiensis TaxID=67801 RepID=A0A1B0B2T7_9MUSC